MKSTAERLAESYCRPQTEGEFSLLTANENDFISFDDIDGYPFVYWDGNSLCQINRPFDNTTEIPVSHFIDLLHDRIVPWRLEEDGFKKHKPTIFRAETRMGDIQIECEELQTDVYCMDTEEHLGVTTYTDLLHLIRMIG